MRYSVDIYLECDDLEHLNEVLNKLEEDRLIENKESIIYDCE